MTDQTGHRRLRRDSTRYTDASLVPCPPGRFRLRQEDVEAMQWLPDDYDAKCAMLAWLDLHDRSRRLTDTGQLMLAGSVAQPGWWVVRHLPPRQQFIALPADTFTEAHEPAPVTEGPALTPAEHEAMDLTAQLWEKLCHIVGTGASAGQDLAELAAPIHTIQNAILAQAAARAYPDRYRLLGGTITRTSAADR
ncbi:hypothetical protein ABZ671_18935 [Micromonospora sp. NPDC006766]|uniref:hypothetical protein n=1 Tax=Micromonospora sp. NPDC006766 TaxID=3154778 RepID=UPI0033C7296A